MPSIGLVLTIVLTITLPQVRNQGNEEEADEENVRPPSVGGEDDRRAKEQSATTKWNKRYTVLLTFKILGRLH